MIGTTAKIKQWYAVYTKSRAEKKVFAELTALSIEAYLPLQRKLRVWSDRKKWVEMPLIPGYLFVNISRKEYETVLKTVGVVSYVKFEGKAAVIPDVQIEYIKHMLKEPGFNTEATLEKIEKGDLIEVIAGPLIGMKGNMVSHKGKNKVAIELSQMNISLLVEIPLSDIQKIQV
jgi:transcription antitermination factor NusG